MTKAPDPVGAVLGLVALIESAGVEYAMSGAIALGYWAVPRATLDLDIALNVEPAGVPALLSALAAGGCILPPGALEAAGRGDFGARFRAVRIDFFLPVLPVSISALRRRVRVPFAESEIWVLSAEDLAIFKLLFGRTKDLADLERLVAAQRGRLDFSYIEREIAALFEDGDERLATYHKLKALALG